MWISTAQVFCCFIVCRLRAGISVSEGYCISASYVYPSKHYLSKSPGCREIFRWGRETQPRWPSALFYPTLPWSSQVLHISTWTLVPALPALGKTEFIDNWNLNDIVIQFTGLVSLLLYFHLNSNAVFFCFQCSHFTIITLSLSLGVWFFRCDRKRLFKVLVHFSSCFLLVN